MKKILVAAASLAFLACGQETIPRAKPHMLSSPIVGGTVDNGHPAVVLVYNSSQGYLCTGSLIDTDVVLTAAHCVEDTNASHYQVAGGTNPFNGAEWVENATQVAAHPSYNPQTVGQADVGVVVLAGAPPVAPMQWLKVVDHSAYAEGTLFTAVGYGITSGTAQDDGTKRKVDLKITELYSDAFLYGDSSASGQGVEGDPYNDGKNSCSGDSGGPAIRNIGGEDVVIGVVSFGDQSCAHYGADMRTDYFAPFISQYATGGGTGPTPTPTANPTNTPGPGGDDDDDDGGTNPGNPTEEDEGLGLFGCRVVRATGPLPLLPIAAFLLLALRRRQ